MARRPAQEQQQPEPQPQQESPRYGLKPEWILVPLVLLGMSYLLKNTSSVITWDDVMNMMGVNNKERYSMLGQLCLLLILIVGTYRIFQKK
ncbi:MAG: hypothetical protein ACYSWQ_04320 [Planctomycetota bacterium]|jgi:hypothetical protein